MYSTQLNFTLTGSKTTCNGSDPLSRCVGPRVSCAAAPQCQEAVQHDACAPCIHAQHCSWYVRTSGTAHCSCAPQLDPRGVRDVQHLHAGVTGHEVCVRQCAVISICMCYPACVGTTQALDCSCRHMQVRTSMLPESKWLFTKMPSPDFAESQLPVVPVTAPSAHLHHMRYCQQLACKGFPA